MKYTKELLEPLVDDCKSIAQLLIKLNLSLAGGNYSYISKKLKHFNINTDHFLGQGWGKNVPSNRKITKDEFIKNILITNGAKKSHRLKLRLYEFGLKEKKCEKCGQGEIWNGEELSLHLDHINGRHNDNILENLQILCPNCHSQTSTYAGKNIGGGIRKIRKKRLFPKQKICECGVLIQNKSKTCHKCSEVKQRKVKRPEYEELIHNVNLIGYTSTGRKYGVSDTTIRNWIKRYKI